MSRNTSKTGIWRTAGVALVLAACLYPCFYFSLLVFDTLRGEQQIIHRALQISQREIWDLFWGDWWAALPFSLALCLPLILLLKRLSANRTGRTRWLPPVLFGGVAIVLSFGLLRGEYLEVLLLTALGYSVLVSMVLSRC